MHFISIKASQEAYGFIFVKVQVKILEKFWCEPKCQDCLKLAKRFSFFRFLACTQIECDSAWSKS